MKKTTLRFLIAPLSALLTHAIAAPAGAAILDGQSNAIMLQGFHWRSRETYPWWNIIASKAGEIDSAGFSMVWFPPSSKAASAEGYLPNELYIQTSSYGTQAQLEAAIDALHARGVSAIADVVVNHRVGTANWADFTNPSWGPDAVCDDDEWSGATGSLDTGIGYGAARDIDHTKAYVRTSITGWMSWLKGTIGYDGWRYDYVRGYGGSYTSQYNSGTAPVFSVGELWDDLDLNNVNAHRQQLMNWIDATGGSSAAFDFTTKGVLQQAVAYSEFWRLRDSAGKPSGAIGWWPSHAVTFIDNHDTGPSSPSGGQNHWPFPSDKVMQGYAYILTHPGVPSVYWVHFFDWGLGNPIKELMNLRLSKGITSTSSVSIQVADSTRYAAIIGGNVAMKIGPGAWSPSGTGWSLATSGSSYAVWTK